MIEDKKNELNTLTVERIVFVCDVAVRLYFTCFVNIYTCSKSCEVMKGKNAWFTPIYRRKG